MEKTRATTSARDLQRMTEGIDMEVKEDDPETMTTMAITAR
jgi:hypothetical protein